MTGLAAVPFTTWVTVGLCLLAVVVVGLLMWRREQERMRWLLELAQEQRVLDAARIQGRLPDGEAQGDQPTEVSVRKLLEETGGVRNDRGEFEPMPTLGEVIRSIKGGKADGDPK